MGKIDDLVVKPLQRAVMTDADDRRPPGCLTQQPIERHFRRLVESRGRLVEKDDFRAGEEHPSKSDALLLPDRQPLRPVALLVEPLAKLR